MAITQYFVQESFKFQHRHVRSLLAFLHDDVSVVLHHQHLWFDQLWAYNDRRRKLSLQHRSLQVQHTTSWSRFSIPLPSRNVRAWSYTERSERKKRRDRAKESDLKAPESKVEHDLPTILHLAHLHWVPNDDLSSAGRCELHGRLPCNVHRVLRYLHTLSTSRESLFNCASNLRWPFRAAEVSRLTNPLVWHNTKLDADRWLSEQFQALRD